MICENCHSAPATELGTDWSGFLVAWLCGFCYVNQVLGR